MWTFEIYSDAGGSYRWRLVAANGQTVASSGDSFASKSNAQEAAENVKKNAGGADIVDARPTRAEGSNSRVTRSARLYPRTAGSRRRARPSGRRVR